MGLSFEPEPRDRWLFRNVDRPDSIGLMGNLRDRALAIEAELVEELRALDAEVQELLDRRSVIEDGLRRCRDALDGNMFRSWRPRRRLPAELDAEPGPTVEVRGDELRAAIRVILGAADRPITIGEIGRGLVARGLRPAGRSSQTISNALGVEVRAGCAVRDDRGVYRSA